MNRKKKYGLLLILFIYIVTFSDALASGGNTNCQLEYLNNKLSINAEKVSLNSLLSKIQQKTGIKIFMPTDESDRMISVRFQSLSIDSALGKILSNLNHAVISGPGGKIQEVIIVGKKNKNFKSQNQQTFEAPPSSNASNIGLPGGGGTEIHQSSKEIKIPQSSKKMVTEGMRSQYFPDKTNTTPDGMIITNHTNSMVIEPPSDEKMKIDHSSTPMMKKLSSKSGGMKITYSSRKMAIRQ